ncbi:MAG: methionyl-tRNA formyltransferase [Gammaproteobacteria bacterium]|nr:methionyl-tRNA formyltransferase [Gammaproteobacteria bacterium]
MSLKVIFAGTPDFALPALQKLLDSEHKVLAVYTQPDRPAGRGLRLLYSPVKKLALEHSLIVKQPASLKTESVQKEMKSWQADIMVDVAYGLFLPKEVFDSFHYGCINIHPSLLPRWRGASPIQQAIIAGDKTTGMTIMQVDEGWDTGPILKQQEVKIGASDTAASMHDKLAHLGAEMVLEVMNKLENDEIRVIPQAEEGATYANKITKEDANINWSEDAELIARKVRAFNSWPVAFSKLGEYLVRIWKAEAKLGRSDCKPGVIVAQSKDSIDVATGSGILTIFELQLPGKRVTSALDLLNSKADLFKVGAQFHA